MNAPFFDLFGDVPEPVAPKRTTGQGCESCLRYKGCRTPKFPVYGQGKRGILIISEFPAAGDDASGTPLSGDAGAILHRELRKHGIDVYRDCWVTHAIRCHSKGDWGSDDDTGSKVRALAVRECRSKLLADVVQLRPSSIIPIGPTAIQGLLGERLSGRMAGTQPTAFIGYQIPDQDLQAWVCPLPGIKHLLQLERKKDIQKLFQRDVANLVRVLGTPVPKAFSEKDVTVYNDIRDFTALLRKIVPGMDIAFDYETTGLKGHRDGHEIYTASVAWGPEGAVKGHACRFHVEDPEFMAEWKRILTDPDIGKTAHQIQFEDGWSNVRGGGIWVDGWNADTCVDAHIIDNTAPTSLKFCTYVTFGIMGYDAEIDKYLKSKDKGGNEFNRIKEAPLQKLLVYNGMDSIASEELRYKQQRKLREYAPNIRGSRFFREALPTLARMSEVGMCLDVGAMEANRRSVVVEMDTILQRIRSYPKVPKDFNPNADKQIMALFYDTLGHAVPRGGRNATAAALQSFGGPIAADVLEWNKLAKIEGTYFGGFLREAVNGILHPAFSLNKVTTFRSGSQDPNFQNIPKRDPIAKKLIRTALKPRPGHVLIEADYKAVEVSIGYCNHHDANMGRYLTDKSSDMHRDGASKIFLLPGSDVKPYRGDTKMLWTFAEFYGSKAEAFSGARHGEVTLKIWEYLQVHPELLDHMVSKGIKNLDVLQDHLVACEKDLWTNMFPGYAAWKKEIWAFYQEHLYVPLKTGFRCHGPLGFNDATNYPIQGPAFHCLLWTAKEASPRIAAIAGPEEAASVGQIHDALVVDCHPRHAEEACQIIQEWGTRKIREAWDWIDTPLTIEIEASEVDGNWADMKPIEERSF